VGGGAGGRRAESRTVEDIHAAAEVRRQRGARGRKSEGAVGGVSSVHREYRPVAESSAGRDRTLPHENGE